MLQFDDVPFHGRKELYLITLINSRYHGQEKLVLVLDYMRSGVSVITEFHE